MSVTLQKERLLKLADPLEADANNPTGVKFDLTVWAAPAAQQEAVEHHDYDAINAAKFREGTTEVPLDCNTAVCHRLGLHQWSIRRPRAYLENRTPQLVSNL